MAVRNAEFSGLDGNPDQVAMCCIYCETEQSCRMNTELANIIRYFHDCYRSYNRDLLIYDFLDKKIEDRVFFDDQEELITGDFPIVPIDSASAIQILKKMQVFEKEKELIYAAFFVCGHYVDFKGDTQRLFSPLFYFPASIHFRDDFYYLSIDPSERRINYPLISLLAKESDEDPLNDELFQGLPADFLRFEDVSMLMQWLRKHFPQVTDEHLYYYPKNLDLKSIRAIQAKLPADDLSKAAWVPASILGIISKSDNTRGVLNELTELAEAGSYSKPLQELFDQQRSPVFHRVYQPGYVPMVLSAAQQALLKSAAVHPLSLIVGPPGTGKSYTIGAIAIEHMNRGESVLIVSRTDEAVDVVAKKISDQLGMDRCVVRGGRKITYASPLNQFLKRLLVSAKPLDFLLRELDIPRVKIHHDLRSDIHKLQTTISKRAEMLRKLEIAFEKEVKNEMEWGRHLSKANPGIWDQLRIPYLNFRNKIQTPLWEFTTTLFQQDHEQSQDVSRLLRLSYAYQITQTLWNHWDEINRFHQALKQRSDTEKLKSFGEIDFQIILKAFPIWLTTLSEIKDVLPFKKELFDVVIIDEATQCDIASCLPAIQRARRVVFAGDPNQLRHVSFLSGSIQHLLQTKYGLLQVTQSILDYRKCSILDLAMSALKSGEQVAMLDEHYRSAAPIIRFSNEQFYQNALRIMTSRPDEQAGRLSVIHCKGRRDKNGSNQEEADRILQMVRELVGKESKLRSAYATSIGILSPFRSQVELIARQLTALFTISEIEKHRIRVGTAYGFQGDERDIMYLSLAVDAESHHSAFIHLNKEEVFNVSITRARSQQLLFTSLNGAELKKDSIIQRYLNSIGQQDLPMDVPMEIHDQFLHEVMDQLRQWKVDAIWPAFRVAGIQIDILVKLQSRYAGIQLVGYPGDFESTFEIERYRILSRAGIPVFPMPYSDWYFERPSATDELKAFLIPSSTNEH